MNFIRFEGRSYQDLVEDYYERRNPQQLAWRLGRRIEELGFEVEIKGLDLAASPKAPEAGVAA